VQVGAFYPPHLGGLETVMRSVSEGVAATTAVTVVTTDCGAAGAPRRQSEGNLRVHRLRGREFAHTPLAPGYLPRLLRISRDHVVHLHLGHALVPELVLLAALARRFPYVAHFHIDADQSGPLGVLLPVYKALFLRPVLRRASCVIALSEKVGAEMSRDYGVPAERVLVMSNGVAPEFFEEPELVEEPGGAHAEDVHTGGRPVRLLFVGRLTRQKNVPRLLTAMTLVRTAVELVIVGDGEDRADVEAQVAALGLTQVRLVGVQVGRELAAWHRWADVFVLTSDVEGGLPLVVLEAMAGGLPVVATDVPGVSDTFGDAGVLAAPDPRSVAEAVDQLAGSPQLRRKVGARNRARAESFSWARRIETLRALYRQVHPDHPGDLDVAALRETLAG